MIDASYSQRTGAVDLRRLELNLPASQIQVRGRLGAYPMSSPTALKLDFRSHDLGEFDTTLRALGLVRNGQTGTAALPVSLSGEADFNGSWDGSLISPRLSGNLKATQIAVEMPPKPNDPSHAPQFVRWDSSGGQRELRLRNTLRSCTGGFVHGQEAILGGRNARGAERRTAGQPCEAMSCPNSTPIPCFAHT